MAYSRNENRVIMALSMCESFELLYVRVRKPVGGV